MTVRVVALRAVLASLAAHYCYARGGLCVPLPVQVSIKLLVVDKLLDADVIENFLRKRSLTLVPLDIVLAYLGRQRSLYPVCAQCRADVSFA